MTQTKEIIINKLEVLPEVALAEVLVFLEELISRSSGLIPDYNSPKTENLLPLNDPFLSVIGCLSGEPLSTEDMENELYG